MGGLTDISSELLPIVQLIFFSVSSIGIVVATLNHFWFVKDRNAQTLISITDIFRDVNSKFSTAYREGVEEQMRTTEFLNVLTVYCHMHNHNQLRPKTKLVHERYVAKMLEAMANGQQFQKYLENIKARQTVKENEIVIFVKKNRKLFSEPEELISFF